MMCFCVLFKSGFEYFSSNHWVVVLPRTKEGIFGALLEKSYLTHFEELLQACSLRVLKKTWSAWKKNSSLVLKKNSTIYYQISRLLSKIRLIKKQKKIDSLENLRVCGKKPSTLFVFSISDHKQNARSLLTPVSGPDFYALSCGTFGFALRGSFLNCFLIGWSNSTANQNRWNRRLLELPWRTNWRVPHERG